MLKIHRFICSDLNIRKNLIVATIGTTNKENKLTSYVQKKFSTYNSDLIDLKNSLIDNNCFEVCMESTGKYWIPVFNILEEDERFHIVLVHPKYVGKKIDKKIPNGFVIFSSTILSKVLLFLPGIFANFVIFVVIVSNSYA
ncbi:hypothetical protein [Thomasclavelia cocleata]|uniref:hypothetical protein n=1 Tax=Thomasclavelia cocleata TaxID=69824 RepID=UPI002431584E|nr:hypothetical protein [Thomasclavelia cocleata]